MDCLNLNTNNKDNQFNNNNSDNINNIKIVPKNRDDTTHHVTTNHK